MTFRFLSALLLSTALSVPAFAEPAPPQHGWKTGSMRQQDGTFAYCVTEAGFANGKWLIVALNPMGDVNLGLGQPKGGLPVGQQSTVTVSVDGKGYQLPAKVTKPELTVINAHSEPGLLRVLASGSRMTIDQDSFLLTGSGQAMADLQECVQVSSAPQQGTAPAQVAQQQKQQQQQQQVAVLAQPSPAPVVPQPTQQAAPVQFDDNTPPVSLPGERQMAPPPAAVVAAPEVVTAPPVVAAPVVAAPVVAPQLPAPLQTLLTNAGLSEITALVPPPAGAAFGWTSGGLTGHVQESTVPTGVALEQAARSFVAKVGSSCPKGQLSSDVGTPVSAGAMQLMAVDMTCATSYSTHVFALSNTGVLSVISHDAPLKQRAAADKVQRGLMKALGGK